MYYKGGNMLHTIRQVIGNDTTWRAVLRGVQAKFAHQIVTGRQVQDYMSAHAGVDLHRVFEQYLTTTKVPVLDYRIDGAALTYRWANVVAGFDMPVAVLVGKGRPVRLAPTEKWQTTDVGLAEPEDFRVDENYYVESKRVDAAPTATGAAGATPAPGAAKPSSP
jgi:aminopeptidase N